MADSELELTESARIIGLDVGEKRIGVALSDPLGLTAQGLTVIHRQGSKKADLRRLKEIAQEYMAALFVVGLPRNMNGSLGPAARTVQDFAGRLGAYCNMPVDFWDERLSSRAAENALLEADVSRRGRKGVIDKVAAVLILQNYLDARRLRKPVYGPECTGQEGQTEN